MNGNEEKHEHHPGHVFCLACPGLWGSSRRNQMAYGTLMHKQNKQRPNVLPRQQVAGHLHCLSLKSMPQATVLVRKESLHFIALLLVRSICSYKNLLLIYLIYFFLFVYYRPAPLRANNTCVRGRHRRQICCNPLEDMQANYVVFVCLRCRATLLSRLEP